MATPQGPFYEQVGQHIAKARAQRHGMTQAKLAKSVGLSRTSIVNIEAGRQPVYLHHLVVIATELEVDVKALIPNAAPTLLAIQGELQKIEDVDARSFAEKVLSAQPEGPHEG